MYFWKKIIYQILLEKRLCRLFKLKLFFLTAVVIVVVRLLLQYKYDAIVLPRGINKRDGSAQKTAFTNWIQRVAVKNYFNMRQKWKTSNLGTYLFKNINSNISDTSGAKTGNFQVLIWKVGPALEKRHIYNYGRIRKDPLEHCSVKNCKFTYKDADISTADAVLIHLHKNNVPGVSYQLNRTRSQRWIFLTDESPEHTFLGNPVNTWKKYANLFNWSMSYITDSDIPVPYGRVVALTSGFSETNLTALIPNWRNKRRDVLVAILISNCSSKRMKLVHALMKYIEVQVFGGCSEDAKDICPGHFHKDCPEIDNFHFYLAFENSRCSQYITEKVFYNAYAKGAIPIIVGTDSESAEQSLPPYSYIYADDYRTPEGLAKDLAEIAKDDEALLSYHGWRSNFKVLNEHGYFGTPSVHYCRICEALNYNDKSESVYDMLRLGQFLDPESLCFTESNHREY